MEKNNSRFIKKMAQLRFKDEIIKLHKDGLSIRKIEQKINYKLARTNLKTSLSKSTIYNIIKKYNHD